MNTEIDPEIAELTAHGVMNHAITDREAVYVALQELRWWHDDTFHKGGFTCGGCLVEQAINRLHSLLHEDEA